MTVRLSGMPTVPFTVAEVTDGAACAGATVMVSVFAALVPLLFVAVSCAVMVPAAVGVPEMRPVVAFRVRPVPVRPVAA